MRPKYGNEPLAEEYIIHPKSADLLSDSQVFRKIYNASGTLSDTREYGKDSYGALIPSKDIFLRLTFLSEIGLDKKLFTLKTSAGKVVDFDIAYVKQDTYDNHHNKTGTKENKQLLEITPKTSLENDTSYQLILSKKANNSLPVDIIKNYQTAKKFQILGQQFLSNTKTCIYMNNGLENEYGYDSYSSQSSIIQTTPVSKIYDLVKDEQMDYYSNTKTYRCTQHPGQISYIIGTRFDPKKDYTITLPAKFEDYYGNAIGKDYSFKVKTGDIAQKDIYLYSSLNNPIQIIPNNLPIVLNLQSINAISANMEVCEMDSGGYMHYLKNRYEKYG